MAEKKDLIQLPEYQKAKSLVFMLDDVLYPQRDYLLQVYYLFSEFMAYTEQLDAKAIVGYMRAEYDREGAIDIFSKTALQFGIAEKYRNNFELLHQTARLPLKLLLFQKSLDYLKLCSQQDKQIYVIAEGNIDMAINKIKQIEWNGLEKKLNLYFTQEFEQSIDLTLKEIIAQKTEKEPPIVLLCTSKTKIDFQDSQVNVFNIEDFF